METFDGVVDRFFGLGEEYPVVAIHGEDAVVSQVEAWIEGTGYETASFEAGFQVQLI